MHFGNVLKADGRIVRLRACGIQWPEPNVVSALSLRGNGLIKTVSGLANKCPLPHHGACFGHRLVILTDVHAFAADGRSDFKMIIDDQRHAVLTQDRLHQTRQFFNLLRAEFLGPQLQQIHAANAQGSGHFFHLCRLHIAEIKDTIKAGAKQRGEGRGGIGHGQAEESAAAG